MECKKISYNVDISLLVLYETLEAFMSYYCYSDEIKSKINKLLKYLDSIIFPFENNHPFDINSINYKCFITYKD